MKKFQELSTTLLEAQASEELHNAANLIVGIAEIYEQLNGCGAELVGDYILRITVSESCIKELSNLVEENLNFPSDSLPYHWIRFDEGRFKVDFQTSK